MSFNETTWMKYLLYYNILAKFNWNYFYQISPRRQNNTILWSNNFTRHLKVDVWVGNLNCNYCTHVNYIHFAEHLLTLHLRIFSFHKIYYFHRQLKLTKATLTLINYVVQWPRRDKNYTIIYALSNLNKYFDLSDNLKSILLEKSLIKYKISYSLTINEGSPCVLYILLN